MKLLILLLVLLAGASRVIAENPCPPTPTVDLNVTRYLGIWYEIATTAGMRDTWERNCDCTYANYTADAKGLLVTNGCRRGSVTSPYTFAVGQAIIPDSSQPGKLAVRFSNLSPYSPYWVIVVDADYTQAVVWSCDDVANREVYNMWVLSRSQAISQTDYTSLVALATALTGIDASQQLIPTLQAGCKPVL